MAEDHRIEGGRSEEPSAADLRRPHAVLDLAPSEFSASDPPPADPPPAGTEDAAAAPAADGASGEQASPAAASGEPLTSPEASSPEASSSEASSSEASSREGSPAGEEATPPRDASPADAPPPPAAAVARRGRAGITFGASLFGVLVGIAVAGAAWLGGWWPLDPVTPELSARLAAIELQVRDLSARPEPSPPRSDEMAALSARVAKLESATPSADTAALSARVAKLESAAPAADTAALSARIAKLENAAPAADTAALSARVAKLESAAPAVDTAALSARVAKLESAAPVHSDPAADATPARRIEAAEAAVRSLGEQMPDLARRADAAVRAVDDRVSDLDRRIEQITGALREVRDRADAAVQSVAAVTRSAADQSRAAAAEGAAIERLAGRISSLEGAAKAIQEDAAKRAAAVPVDRPARLAVLAGAVRAAVERGDPFAAELAAIKPLMADRQALAALEPFAARGVPSASTLARELVALLPAMERIAEPEGNADGFLARLKTNAERVVRIRPVEAAAGDDAAALLAKAQAHAERGDLAGAVADLGKLTAAVRAPADDWIKKAQARLAALTAAQRNAADALAAVAGGGTVGTEGAPSR